MKNKEITIYRLEEKCRCCGKRLMLHKEYINRAGKTKYGKYLKGAVKLYCTHETPEDDAYCQHLYLSKKAIEKYKNPKNREITKNSIKKAYKDPIKAANMKNASIRNGKLSKGRKLKITQNMINRNIKNKNIKYFEVVDVIKNFCSICGKSVLTIKKRCIKNHKSHKIGDIVTIIMHENKSDNKLCRNLKIKLKSIGRKSSPETVEKLKNRIYSKESRDKISRSKKGKKRNPESIQKGIQTKIQNGTINTSNPEDNTYQLLRNIYPDVIRNYKDKIRYPNSCDFYIPSLDLFIECQYHWTHNGCDYIKNPNSGIYSIDFIKNKIREKGGMYIVLWNTWTGSDVKKRENAKNNNLNYLELWSCPKNTNELKSIIDNFMNSRK